MSTPPESDSPDIKPRIGHGAQTDSLATRIRRLREAHGLTRKELVAQIGWSESRLTHYESGKTEPTVSDLAALARLFTANPAELAFGPLHGGSGTPANGPVDIAWLPVIDGGSIPVPKSLLGGMLGPFECVVLADSGGGMSSGDILVIKKADRPRIGQAWVIRDPGGAARPAWITEVDDKHVQVRFGIAGACHQAPTSALLGQIIASMQQAT